MRAPQHAAPHARAAESRAAWVVWRRFEFDVACVAGDSKSRHSLFKRSFNELQPARFASSIANATQEIVIAVLAESRDRFRPTLTIGSLYYY